MDQGQWIDPVKENQTWIKAALLEPFFLPEYMTPLKKPSQAVLLLERILNFVAHSHKLLRRSWMYSHSRIESGFSGSRSDGNCHTLNNLCRKS